MLRPENSMWPGTDDLVPPELLHMREWLHDMFQQASRGLPWPHQAGLLIVEHAITLGLFGGYMASAWSLHQPRPGAPAPSPLDLGALLAQLDFSTTGALPEPVRLAMRQVRAHLDRHPLQDAASVLSAPWWSPPPTSRF